MERGLQELHKEAEAAEAKVTEDFQGSGVKDMDNIEVKDTDNVKVKDTQSDVVIQISDKIESVKGSMSEPKASGIKLHEHIEAVKSDSVIKSEGSSERETELMVLSETNDTYKTRKKRRRKKKNTPSVMSKLKPDAANGHTGDTEDGDIFEMEDLSSDEEMSRLTSGMSTSISLPVVEESKLERTNEWATAHEGFYLNQHPFSDTDLSPLGR